jgi:hypothetical protein
MLPLLMAMLMLLGLLDSGPTDYVDSNANVI